MCVLCVSEWNCLGSLLIAPGLKAMTLQRLSMPGSDGWCAKPKMRESEWRGKQRRCTAVYDYTRLFGGLKDWSSC